MELVGLLLTGVGFFLGILGGNVRGELVLLALGAVVFFGGRFLEKKGAGT